MRKLISIILLFSIVVLGYSQKTQIEERRQIIKENVIINSVIISAVTLNAYGDARNHMGHNKIGHLSNTASIACLLALPYLQYKFEFKQWWVMPIKYGTARLSLFNPIYNTTRGLPLDYTGTSNYTDEIFAPRGFHNIWFRGIPLTFSILIPIE